MSWKFLFGREKTGVSDEEFLFGPQDPDTGTTEMHRHLRLEELKELLDYWDQKLNGKK